MLPLFALMTSWLTSWLLPFLASIPASIFALLTCCCCFIVAAAAAAARRVVGGCSSCFSFVWDLPYSTYYEAKASKKGTEMYYAD